LVFSCRARFTWSEADWHEEIRTAIPPIIAALQDSDEYVAFVASGQLLRLAEEGELLSWPLFQFLLILI
jgi:hypothetical protein